MARPTPRASGRPHGRGPVQRPPRPAWLEHGLARGRALGSAHQQPGHANGTHCRRPPEEEEKEGKGEEKEEEEEEEEGGGGSRMLAWHGWRDLPQAAEDGASSRLLPLARVLRRLDML
ncbi:unnamed protein product [Prorocentrum cordatum]|uniref:Uncharacterized protein n=1 Tax=Prorocentrum cordatum TaxID=2364126 RepID=A0ABN9QGM3_9DINO|nr:unnamed protein product [Polarella glacialis]